MEEEFIRNQEQMKGTLMSVGTLEEIIGDRHVIMSTSVGSEQYISILLYVHAIIGVFMDDIDPLVTMMTVEKTPQETCANVGELELPLTHPEYYEEMALLAKGVANQTSATFLKMVGSELTQKYLGNKRYNSHLMVRNSTNNIGTVEPVDGFDSRDDMKVIMATNRIETLDTTKKHIFQIHTSKMLLADDVTLNDLIMGICTEAGLMALKECRMKVINEDLKKSKENALGMPGWLSG
ncbi:unnamed protein product [Nyctereutes procyonoides]|uniref:(raccoon dog) hypothetical protein n=1 Tax=Nyctereutes procyonoides TaxID=34880 RepID=A0A812A1E6_NYCPR|nr:unnamed protein product [Nyctereutes procyonoides]